MGFGVWQGGWFDSTPPIMLNDPVHNGEQDYSSETNNNNTTNNTVEDSMKVFNVISLSQGNTGEFAADMYRPEGFNDNIGSVLALKMSIVEDANYEFPVIVRIPDKTNLEQVLNDANNSVNMTINIAEASCVSISGEISTTDKYYYLLTAEQIIALADSGEKCYYVGSGEGDYKNMNWDTVEGINAYCSYMVICISPATTTLNTLLILVQNNYLFFQAVQYQCRLILFNTKTTKDFF